MKQHASFTFVVAILALLISVGAAASGLGIVRAEAEAAPGSGFTYQGRLDKDGAPANGSFDFQFALYDSLSGGAQIGPTLTVGRVSVSDGQFTVALDFGPVFWNEQRFLEARVRPASSGSYVTLSPRQLLTAAPIAGALPGVFTDQSLPFVGVGRAARVTNSEVFGLTADKGATGNSYGGMYINTVSPEGRPFYGYATGGDAKAWTNYDPAANVWEVYTQGSRRLQVSASGLSQPGDDNGLVKAAVFANCSSASPSILRSFVNNTQSAATISWNGTLQSCIIDFAGFDISQRYFVATANSSTPRFVSCVFASSTSLSCNRWRPDGTHENGNIMILVY